MLYYLLARHQHSQELYGWSSVHITLLNTVCGLTLVLSNLADAQEGKLRPGFFAGVLATSGRHVGWLAILEVLAKTARLGPITPCLDSDNTADKRSTHFSVDMLIF